MCETMTNKIESTSNLNPHVYFTEQMVGVIDNPPHKYNKNPKNLGVSI
jgi:hypothetical protein